MTKPLLFPMNIQYFNGTNMNLTTSPSLSPEFQTFYNRTLLNRLRQNYIHRQWAQRKPMPANNGKRVQFRRFGDLEPALVPLTEGVTPDGNQAKVSEIFAEVAQYGDYLMFSDMVDLTALDPELTSYAEVLGDQAGETLDILTRDELASGTNVIWANGKNDRSAITPSDKLTTVEVRKARRFLKKHKVKPLQGGYYVAIVGPDTTYDLQDDPKWEDAQKYGANAKGLFDGEIGRIYGVRFVETPNAKIFEGAGADGADVHCTIVLGADAYGIVDINGSGNIQNIIKPLGSAGTTDPLNQRQTTGWKVMAWAVKRLQELAIVRIEHGASL